ncbi:MAG: Ig-like domain repeat protein [Terriglobales bacterium]
MRCCTKLSLVVLLALAGLPRAAAQNAKSIPARIGIIDESSLAVLKGNHHPWANPSNDHGPVAPDLPMQRMLLVFKRDPAEEPALAELLEEQQDKSSPNYHQWLSPEQFGERFGASPSDLQTAAAWLASHGLEVNRISRGGSTIEFSGSAGQVEQTFHSAIHRYVVKGETHFANAADPQIPSALASVVAGVDTLHNFQKPSPIRPLGSASRIGNTSTWQPNFTFNSLDTPFHYLAPGDFAKIYNTSPLYQAGIDGSGQSIAIAGRNNINLSDIEIFRIAFGLPANNPQIILDGPDPGNSLGGSDETEADLDVEWSGAIAPKATIKFVVSASTNTTDGIDLSSQYIVDNDVAPVMSVSYGQCEALLGQAENVFYNNLWEQAAAEGITVVVASGDNGDAGCDLPFFGPATQGPAVSGLASTPFNIAAGGTQFNENGADNNYWAATNGLDQSSVLGYIPEAVWNESCSDLTQCGSLTLYAGSGGASSVYAKPPWQSGPGVPADGKRDLPDISLAAAAQHDGYLLCQDGVCLTDATGQLINAYVVGGTSAAAPTFAAIMALANQKLNSRQGQADFVLYPLAATQNAANCNSSTGPAAGCVFNDITQGNNNVPGQSGFAAAAGYDQATGLGSPNAANLVSGWGSISFRPTGTQLQLSQSTITHGQPVNVTVTVAPVTGTGTPGGNVVLLAGSGPSVNLGNLNGGSLSTSIANLPGGSYPLTAGYGGDGSFGASRSSSVPVTVNVEASIVTFTTLDAGLSASASTSYSNDFYLSVAAAGVSGQGIATGTVSFSDTFNGTTRKLTALPLNSQGNALVPETTLAVGTHVLNATYSGDQSFAGKAALPLTVTVSKGETQSFLFLPTGAPPNSAVILQAIVFPNGHAAPTGTVQFEDGSTPIGGPIKVVGEVATFTTQQLGNGPHSITAAYSGDANFNSSTSTPATITIANPDFLIGVNPGTVTVSKNIPGKANILLSPGPGLGFAGVVSLSCSRLPAGSSCVFQPQNVTLDGFSSASTSVTIGEPGSQSLRRASTRDGSPWRIFTSSVGGFVLVGLLSLPRRRKRICPHLCLIGILACFIGLSVGCGGGSSSPQTAPPATSPSGQSYTVTLTAAGGSGSGSVSHGVNMQVNFQ